TAYIELSQESDFNPAHNHPNRDDTVTMWNGVGHPFLGQPSVVYQVPFHYDMKGASAIATKFAGYGAWDGADGDLRPADATITDQPGTGAGRLIEMSDGVDHFRFKVVVGGCSGDGGMSCEVPGTPTDLKITPGGGNLAVSFRAPSSGPMPSRFSVRYRPGESAISDADFDKALTGPEVSAGKPGDVLTARI